MCNAGFGFCVKARRIYLLGRERERAFLKVVIPKLDFSMYYIMISELIFSQDCQLIAFGFILRRILVPILIFHSYGDNANNFQFIK